MPLPIVSSWDAAAGLVSVCVCDIFGYPYTSQQQSPFLCCVHMIAWSFINNRTSRE
jgi:hypothetical protein